MRPSKLERAKPIIKRFKAPRGAYSSCRWKCDKPNCRFGTDERFELIRHLKEDHV